MNEIVRRDREILIRALVQPSRVIGYGAIFLFGLYVARQNLMSGNFPFLLFGLGISLIGAVKYGTDCVREANANRFMNKHYEALWVEASNRISRLNDALKQMGKDRLGDLTVLPVTVRNVGDSVYVALRRADMIYSEIEKSEGSLPHSTHLRSGRHPASDEHVQELYRQADRNIAEYRQRFSGIYGALQRCEAQAAVFVTTLDNLRIRILGYRLMGRTPEIEMSEFKLAMDEAKMQLEAVDTALSELDYNSLPSSVTTVTGATNLEMLKEPFSQARDEIASPIEQMERENGIESEQVSSGQDKPPPLPPDVKIEERPQW